MKFNILILLFLLFQILGVPHLAIPGTTDSHLVLNENTNKENKPGLLTLSKEKMGKLKEENKVIGENTTLPPKNRSM